MIAKIVDLQEKQFVKPTTPFPVSDFKVGDFWVADFPYPGKVGEDPHPCLILEVHPDELTVLAIRTTHDRGKGAFREGIELPILGWEEGGLWKKSYFVLNNVRKVDVADFYEKLKHVTNFDWVSVTDALEHKYPNLHFPESV